MMGIVSAEEGGQKAVAIGITVRGEVGRSAHIDHGLHFAGVFREGRIGSFMSLFHSQKSRQLCARGMPECADMVGIDSVFCGVGTNPAHRTLYVVQLYRPAILGAMHQPVID